MKTVHPPRIAASLLERFAPLDQDALAGDLYEEFSRGRSSVWFWRQVLAAIVVGAWREVRSDPRRAMCGVLIGWLALGTLAPIALRLFNDGPVTLSMFVWRPLDASLFWLLARMSAPAVMSSGLLWRVSRSPGIVLTFAATMVAVSIVSSP